MKTTQKLFATTIACALLTPAALLAQFNPRVPNTMFYEGYLELSDAPANGMHDFTFEFYAADTGGSPLFTETINNVTVTEGWFTVELGRAGELWNIALERDAWLLVSVDGTPMPPREPLHSVPYALRAGAVEWENVIGVPADQTFGDIAADSLTATATVTAVDLVATDLTLTNPPTITSPTVKTLLWSAGPNAVWQDYSAAESTAVPCFSLINGRGACSIAGSQTMQLKIHVFLNAVPDLVTITEWGMHTGGNTTGSDTWTCDLMFLGEVVDTLTFDIGNNDWWHNELNTGLSIPVVNDAALPDGDNGNDNAWTVVCSSDDTTTGRIDLKYIWIKYTDA